MHLMFSFWALSTIYVTAAAQSSTACPNKPGQQTVTAPYQVQTTVAAATPPDLSQPATFSTLPAIPSSLLPNVTLPPINATTNTSSGRFILQAITSLTDPETDGYTNGTQAIALNHTNAVFTSDDTKATVSFLSSTALPLVSTFQLNQTCFQTWDGRVAYAGPQNISVPEAAGPVATAPLLFGDWNKLCDEERARILSCNFPAGEASFWAGSVTQPRALTCEGPTPDLKAQLREMFVCERGVYSGAVQMGPSMPSGCVPVALYATGAGEPGVVAKADLVRHRRGVHRRW